MYLHTKCLHCLQRKAQNIILFFYRSVNIFTKEKLKLSLFTLILIKLLRGSFVKSFQFHFYFHTSTSFENISNIFIFIRLSIFLTFVSSTNLNWFNFRFYFPGNPHPSISYYLSIWIGMKIPKLFCLNCQLAQ